MRLPTYFELVKNRLHEPMLLYIRQRGSRIMIWLYGQRHIFLSGSLSSLNTMVYASQSMAVFFAGCVVGRLFTLCPFFYYGESSALRLPMPHCHRIPAIHRIVGWSQRHQTSHLNGLYFHISPINLKRRLWRSSSSCGPKAA